MCHRIENNLQPSGDLQAEIQLTAQLQISRRQNWEDGAGKWVDIAHLLEGRRQRAQICRI